MRVGGNVQDSKLIHRVDPEYPEVARRARVEAMVILEVLVNEQGEVANIRVVRGHPLLEQAAIRCREAVALLPDLTSTGKQSR